MKQTALVAQLAILVTFSLALPGSALADTGKRTVDDAYALASSRIAVASLTDKQNLPGPMATLYNELLDCGFSLKGPACLDSAFKPNTKRPIINPYDNPQTGVGPNLFIYIPVVAAADDSKKLLILLIIPKDKKLPVSMAGIRSYPLRDSTLADIYNSPLARYADAQLAAPDQATKTLYAAPNIRSLYHATQTVLANQSVSRAAIALTLNQQKATILKSTNPVYLYAFLELIRNQFPDARSLAGDIAELLFQLPGYSTRPLVPITLAENGSKNPEVHRRVRALLDDGSPEIRELAFDALNQVRDLQDEIAMLYRLKERERKLVTKVFNVLNTFQLKDEHVFALSELLSWEDEETRSRAVALISKIPGDRVTDLLLERLADSNDNVVRDAMKALETRKLKDSNIARLEELLSHPRQDIRARALEELGRIPSPEINATLIASLGDSDRIVSDTAFRVLEKRPLTNRDLYPLQKFLTHDREQVRSHTVVLVGHIDHPDATGVLLQRLVDPGHDVRLQVMQALDKREILPQHVYDLYKIKDNPDARVRELVADYLGRIKDPEATTVLIEMFADEDVHVYERVKRSIDKRPVNDRQVELLVALLRSSPSMRARSLSAYTLGGCGRPSALAELKLALETESDHRVRQDILNAIRNAGGS